MPPDWAAINAMERAYHLAADETRADRLDYLRAILAPAFQPRIGFSRDSDGNTHIRTAIGGDFDASSYMEYETESILAAIDVGAVPNALRNMARVLARGVPCFAGTPCWRSVFSLAGNSASKSTRIIRGPAPRSVQLPAGNMHRSMHISDSHSHKNL